jgi:ATP synthase I chain
MIESVREAQKKYCSRAMIAAILFGLVFILWNQPSVGKGLILGTLFSVVNFVIMGESLPSKIGKTKSTAAFVSLLWVLARYGLMAVPLVLALKYQQFNFPAVICGLFLVQLTILGEHIVSSVFIDRQKNI